MLKHIRKHRHSIAAVGVLMFVAGCYGAVSKTADQLSHDAMMPVTVPIEQGNKAKDKLNQINAAQLQQNQEMEEIK